MNYPVILFVYNRPDLTERTLQSLKNNLLAEVSDLYIYSDCYKSLEDKLKVEQVRSLIRDIEGFKSVTIFEATSNKGLANSVIDGVTTIIKKSEGVIVIEDDLLTSPYFLSYMNSALNYYKDHNNIWSISGYNPVEVKDIIQNKDVYFTGRASSWGWATWNNRWILNNWDLDSETEDIFINKVKQRSFNEYGNDLVPMLKDQKNKNIDSWAIRWCFNQFLRDSYTVYPSESLVQNLGLIGESTHGSIKSTANKVRISDKYSFEFSDLYLNSHIINKFKKHYDLKIHNHFGFLLKKLKIYKPVKKMLRKTTNVLGG